MLPDGEPFMTATVLRKKVLDWLHKKGNKAEWLRKIINREYTKDTKDKDV